MKISTKGTYALEIVTDLALHTKNGQLASLNEIAKRRNLSEKYLERIIKSLKQHGIVKSTRGAKGGYSLAKEANQITVLDVLRAVEGELAPVACLTNQTNCRLDCGHCMTKDTWSGIWNEIIKVVKSTTIKDITTKITQ